MDRTTRPRRAWAIALTLVCFVGCAVPAGARTRSAHAAVIRIAGKRGAHHRATFHIKRLRHRRVIRAVVVVSGHRRKVTPKKVSQHVHQGTLVVPLPTGSTPPAAPQSSGSAPTPAPAPVLVVTVSPPAAPTTTSPGSTTTTTTTTTTPQPDPTPTTPAPTTAPSAPLVGPTSELVAPGSPILTDSDAASHVRRSAFEPRPANATANATVPTASEIDAFRVAQTGWGSCQPLVSHVTGNFTGTTDEIIQWAAWKWGLPEDVVRAEAAKETWWKQDFVGDSGQSFGIMQIKRTVHLGTYPASAESTAFNLDYYGATIRYYYDGCAGWLNNVDHVGTYAAGDLWGSIGAWYAGRWHTTAAEGYISSVKTLLAQQVWLLSSF